MSEAARSTHAAPTRNAGPTLHAAPAELSIEVEGKLYRVGAPDAGTDLSAAAALVERHAQTLAASGLSPSTVAPSRFFLMTALLVAEEALSRGDGGAAAADGGGLSRALEQQAFERAVAEVMSAAAERIEALADRVEQI